MPNARQQGEQPYKRVCNISEKSMVSFMTLVPLKLPADNGSNTWTDTRQLTLVYQWNQRDYGYITPKLALMIIG